MYRVNTVFSGPLVAGGGICRLYFDEAGGTAADAHAAVVSFFNAVDEVMSTQVAFTVEAEVELVNAATGAITGIESTDAYSATGTGSGDPLPPATQGLVRWRTGAFVDGREVRGRTFLPGMLESLNDSAGKPNSGALTVINVAAGNLIGDGDSELVIYSRTKSLQATVVSGQAWSQWAQLRGRRD